MVKILILDYIDHARLLDQFIRTKFNKLNFKIWHTEDLDEFLVLIKKHDAEIDLLLIDKSRSVGEAENIVEFFRKENQTSSIFFLTSWEDNDDLIRMKRAGLITAIFEKPCNLEKLYQAIKIILEHSPADDMPLEDTYDPEHDNVEYLTNIEAEFDLQNEPLSPVPNYISESKSNKFLSGLKTFFVAIGGLIIYIVGFLALVIIGLFFIKGGLWLSSNILSGITNILWIIFLIDLIMIPIAFFKVSRSIYGSVLFISSFLYGITLWTWAFLLSYQIWGVIGLIIGLLIMGVGVVPIAIVGSIVEGQWGTVLTLIIFVVITFGSRTLGMVFAEE